MDRTTDTPGFGGGGKNNVVTTVISCIERDAAREATLPQLIGAGLEPMVFYSPCDPPGPGNNRVVMTRAMAWAVSTGEDVLYCEDDIDLAPDFPLFLDAVTRCGFDAVYLYMNDNPDLPGRLRNSYRSGVWESIAAGEPQERRLEEPPTCVQLYGSQCVFLKAGAAARLLELAGSWRVNDLGGGPAGDTIIRSGLALLEARVGMAVPHPVQHRHDLTLYERRSYQNPAAGLRVKRSASFALERVGTSVSF